MKLTERQFELLRSSVDETIYAHVETLMGDIMDNCFRDEIMDDLSDEDFTEDEKDELREMWYSDEGGDVDVERFVKEVVDGIMMKYK